MNLVSLQTKTTYDFEVNLQNLQRTIEELPKNSIVLANELCLTGYAYDRLPEAVSLGQKAIELLKKLSKDKTIALTLTTKSHNEHYNTFFLFSKGKIVHTQNKVALFALNEEKKYFKAGEKKSIQLFEVEGLKVGVLICFELRFIELWQQLKGADIILVPAMWGAPRKENYETLTQALAVANQCFVIASDCANEECAKGSAIISPFGNVVKDDSKTVIEHTIDLKEIEKMRKYLYVGIE